ncbi:type II toxin-antitoxin system VapB family antitoxin [Sphingomonas sp. CJ20]
MASLYIKDQEANALAERLAAERGLTKTAAVKLALRHELERSAGAAPAPDRRPLRERMVDFWERHPLPDTLGPPADKAFFDSLSDEP